MNKNLDEIIKIYTTRTHKELTGNLLRKSKEAIVGILVDLLTSYFNDKNSSTLREYVLVVLSGFTPNEAKIGYNGYKHEGIDGARSDFCEAKPKNINTHSENPKKLNGSSNFTDYTFARFKRNKHDNPLMIVGGFIDGKLIYMFRFPFNSRSFTNVLKTRLIRRFPGGADIPGQFLRSATFSLSDYKDIDGLKLKVFVSKEELEENRKHITGPLYLLLERAP